MLFSVVQLFVVLSQCEFEDKLIVFSVSTPKNDYDDVTNAKT